MVLVGNLGGRLKTAGRFLQFPGYGKAGHRTIAKVCLTLLHAVSDKRKKTEIPITNAATSIPPARSPNCSMKSRPDDAKRPARGVPRAVDSLSLQPEHTHASDVRRHLPVHRRSRLRPGGPGRQ
jgi:hypothetical protein